MTKKSCNVFKKHTILASSRATYRLTVTQLSDCLLSASYNDSWSIHKQDDTIEILTISQSSTSLSATSYSDSWSVHKQKTIQRLVCIPRKYKWQVGYSMVYHKKALHNYFIPCHRKYRGQHNQCDVRPDFIFNGFELASYCLQS